MPRKSLVTTHYTRGDLLTRIQAALGQLGKDPDTVTIDDLGPVDEFHVGGRLATQQFLDRLDIAPNQHVLDVGCGLGGASRFAANRYGCGVSGVDLTSEYVTVGNTINQWVGLEEKITLREGDALAMPFESEAFDRAYLMHVGMNISDKERLARELYRLVKSGGKVGIYDIMRMGDGELEFPLPWATSSEGSALATPDEYIQVLKSAGFGAVTILDRREFALDFFAQVRQKLKGSPNPPALGLHLVMGQEAPTKIKNLVGNIARGAVAPVELIATKES